MNDEINKLKSKVEELEKRLNEETQKENKEIERKKEFIELDEEKDNNIINEIEKYRKKFTGNKSKIFEDVTNDPIFQKYVYKNKDGIKAIKKLFEIIKKKNFSEEIDDDSIKKL